MLMPAVLSVLGAGRRFGLNRLRFRHVSFFCVAPGFSHLLLMFTILWCCSGLLESISYLAYILTISLCILTTLPCRFTYVAGVFAIR
jgi:hypothetical protein